MLFPLPVVVDADVLRRCVDYALRKGYFPALLGQASTYYSLMTGVTVFATVEVEDEAMRLLPDVARSREVPLEVVEETWDRCIVPRVRFVPTRDDMVSDSRVAEVRQLDASDAPTAALTSLLAPAILATDNRRHFRPMGLVETKTDDIARDVFALGKFGGEAQAMLFLPHLAAVLTAEGSKKLVATFGREGAALVGLLAVAGGAIFLRSDRGRMVLEGVSNAARRAGPPAAATIVRANAVGERVAGFAVQPANGERDALAVIARRLATGQSVMTTREVIAELRFHGFAFDGPGRFETRTRAWLEDEPCFYEGARGRWTLGYHVAPIGTAE